jgi:serine-type D-Ala-D-Ala carboxypeptidase/endopeptidase (penicillin-binding protein 4)
VIYPLFLTLKTSSITSFTLNKNLMIHKLTQQKHNIISALILLSFYVGIDTVSASPSRALSQLEQMSHASLAIADDPQHSVREDAPMVPASTLKVFTALLAFKTWSPDHRFETDFYLDGKNILWVKGLGDPFINSEEMGRIARALRERGLTHINGVSVDSHYFAADIKIDGKSHTQQPYDAPVGALAVNFNTLTVVRNKSVVLSGESQTPVTPLMQKLANRVPKGYHRINLGEQANSGRYFAEMLKAKLAEQGVHSADFIGTGRVPDGSEPFYHHRNSHTLSQVVSEMLHHSNNFIANQLFLMMGAERYGAPATITKSQRAAAEKVHDLFGWKQQIFYEGSGLSYRNQLSANQFLQVLEEFAPYKSLLKSQGENILAKTGTLTGVSSYAGYLHRSKRWVPFALFINQPIHGGFRKQLAQELLSLKFLPK